MNLFFQQGYCYSTIVYDALLCIKDICNMRDITYIRDILNGKFVCYWNTL